MTADVEHTGDRGPAWGTWKCPPSRRANITSEARIGNTEGHKVHLTVDFDDEAKACAIKLEVHKEGAAFRGMLDALAGSMSQSLQHGATLAEVASRLRGVRFEPDGAVFGCEGITTCTSIVDLVGQMLEAEVSL